jgi:uncharacterized protein (DUF2336 family)
MHPTPFSIGHLEGALQDSSHDKRVDILRRITDLFLRDAERYREEQVGLFDDVLNRLIGLIESEALIELAQQLAPVSNAPTQLIRRLAQHHEIAVAEHVLTLSPRLTTPDLVSIAQSQGQDHLLAISNRSQLDEPVTDVLIDRANSRVAQAVTDNQGARISQAGYAALVTRSQSDDPLAVKLGLRPDIPPEHFQKLLLTATTAAKLRLLAEAPPDLAIEIDHAVTRVANELAASVPTAVDYAAALELAKTMQLENRLSDATVFAFASAKKVPETLAALSVLSFTPITIVGRLLQGERIDGILIPCKAAALTWPTVKAILTLAPAGRAMSDETARRDYLTLSGSTAQRIIRFW